MEKIAAEKPDGIILREKDLSEDEYKTLAKSIMAICSKHGTACILHSFTKAAFELGCRAIHLPMDMMRTLSNYEKSAFDVIGVSCHSAKEACEAEALGCTYITAGHIFATDCKKNLPGRGIEFLRDVCKSVSVPVYAIGGITAENAKDVLSAGAYGVCVMSGTMMCSNPREYLSPFKEM